MGYESIVSDRFMPLGHRNILADWDSSNCHEYFSFLLSLLFFHKPVPLFLCIDPGPCYVAYNCELHACLNNKAVVTYFREMGKEKRAIEKG